MLRRLFLFAIVTSFAIGGIGSYALSEDWVSEPYAAALTASTAAIMLFVVITMTARKINSLEHELREMSLTDELTKLYNRRAFYLLGEHALRETKRAATPLAILFFDVDDLKKINDTLGHDAGSQLLVDFAKLIRANFHNSDVTARLGGDEFAVVTRARQSEWLSALQHLDAAVAAANEGNPPYRLSYSVGEMIGDPADEESFAKLVDRADAAMYQHKRQKKIETASNFQQNATADVVPTSTPMLQDHN